MKLISYFFPIIFMMYGILTLKGIHVPRIQPDEGMGWLITGVIFLFVIAILDYLYYRGILKTGYEGEIEPKKPMDIFCTLVFMLGMTYLAIYFFKLYVNDIFFAIVLLIFAFCGKSIVKYSGR